MCESMKWNHLPVAGGLYDQHPQLLEEFAVIFREKAAKEQRDRDEQDRKQKQQQASAGRGKGRRR